MIEPEAMKKSKADGKSPPQQPVPTSQSASLGTQSAKN